ncbi:hypothetical protein Clacol_000650 [Clathrus columnatus]|uniref:Uncharacterized protein n=1 Tax=Clathrus columnatus TaxID=1419009 RepID=A0AAV4ZZU9_9AGAM|nr:hypothetical protein Clacol_000650 [Clathrus columnatus]
MERVRLQRFKESTPEESSATPDMVSRLLEQIGVLKTKNETLMSEHQESLRKYEEKLSQQESQLVLITKDNMSLREQLASRSKESYSSNTDSHITELEQMKGDLGQCRKALADQTKAFVALQKQLNTTEGKVKDLKKAAITDQVEIKSLRSRVQNSDENRTKEQLKCTMRQLEAKHKSEVCDLNSRFQTEFKKHDSQIKQRDASEEKLQNQLRTAEQELESVHQKLSLTVEKNQKIELDLESAREELSGLRDLISRITQAYSVLANSSVSCDKYGRIENMYLSTRFRLFRLERRLADREIIIEQLTDFCKQLSEEKRAIKKFLDDMDSDGKGANLDLSGISDELRDMAFVVDTVTLHMTHLQEENHLKQAECDVLMHMRRLYEEHSNDLLTAYTVSDIETAKLSALQSCMVSYSSHMMEEMCRVNAEKDCMVEELSMKATQITESETKQAALDARLTNQREELRALEAASKKHLQRSQQLAQALYHSQKKEQHLGDEIARLSDDVEDALRYKEAHADLLSEVVALIQRNELAEAEAERLSKFNAEILGHKNPQQKIYYMDRIRSELADAKHELLRSSREREVLAVSAATLQSELALYKSITVPIEHKPIGSRVRVERIGLHSLDLNRLSQEGFAESPRNELS